jgi:hypothetical protein
MRGASSGSVQQWCVGAGDRRNEEEEVAAAKANEGRKEKRKAFSLKYNSVARKAESVAH